MNLIKPMIVWTYIRTLIGAFLGVWFAHHFLGDPLPTWYDWIDIMLAWFAITTIIVAIKMSVFMD